MEPKDRPKPHQMHSRPVGIPGDARCSKKWLDMDESNNGNFHKGYDSSRYNGIGWFWFLTLMIKHQQSSTEGCIDQPNNGDVKGYAMKFRRVQNRDMSPATKNHGDHDDHTWELCSHCIPTLGGPPNR